MLEPYGFNSATIGSIEGLLESDRTISGKRFESENYVVTIERTRLCVRSRESAAQSGSDGSVQGTPAIDDIMPVRCPGVYNFNGVRYNVEILPYTPDMPLKQPEGILIADADKLTFPFVCRRWRQGDWMIPFGMRGRKKVSDIFADMKYTSVQKNRSIMIVDKG